MSATIYMLAFAMMVVGLYAIIAKKNVVKIIIGVLIIDYMVNLLLVLVGYRSTDAGLGVAPILGPEQTPEQLASTAVDPLPQAMVLTSIVIGLGLAALMVAMALRLYDRYGTFDTHEMRRLKG